METPAFKGNPAEMSSKVSRSGRVLKKSSILKDFTSPDDIETAKIKKIDKATRKQLNLTQFSHIKMEPNLDMTHILPAADSKGFMMSNCHQEDRFTQEYSLKPGQGSYLPNSSHNNDDSPLDSDSDDQRMVIKTEDDPEVDFATPRRSIYMTEKSSKKKIFKDGKIVLGKAQRKDKGKTRFTAYMLWAKEARQQISNSNPEMDFASVSKRLGEMWANVPANVKYNWKRRAKRLANKLKKNGNMKKQETSKYIQQKYLNKNSTNLLSSSHNNSAGNSATPLTKQQKQLQKLMKSEKIKKQSMQIVQKQQKEQKLNAASPYKRQQQNSLDSSLSPAGSSGYKSTMTSPNKQNMNLSPIDMAAHLQLLGENLTNIGEALKAHEGQIAVSGSLSVLLDSLLCAVGPLICLTSFVPKLDLIKSLETQQTETEHQQYVKDLLQNIMDNLDYILPGL